MPVSSGGVDWQLYALAMPTLTVRSPLPVPREEAFAWHTRPGAFERLAPPWTRLHVVDPGAGVAEGSQLTFDAWRGPLRIRWVAHHFDVRPGVGFSDSQVRGPMRRWTHVHTFEGEGPTCRLVDEVRFDPPLGRVGGALAGGRLRTELERLFRFRHARLQADLRRLRAFDTLRKSTRPLRIAVSGASGFLGAALHTVLSTGGHSVVRLVRHRSETPGEVLIAPGAGSRGGQIDLEPLEGLDVIVHLAGEPVSGRRWTKERMSRVRDSRVESTRLLSLAVSQLRRPPAALVVASGVGYYGDRGDELLSEDAGVGSGFFAELTRDWEAAAEPARMAGVRTSHLRFGAVLGASGGLLGMLKPWHALGLGMIAGPGTQWWSWIGLDDAISALMHAAADPSVAGPVNVVSPQAVTAQEFGATLARVLDRPLLARAPAWLIRLAAGGAADWALSSVRTVPAALRARGFEWATPTLDAALRWELGLSTAGDGVSVVWSR
ncbi:MAG: TIGR01777 family protein [Leptolyngbya sp. PLA1]|nr:TIGR01777 family protein [Leptolyngbya sp. PLA1]